MSAKSKKKGEKILMLPGARGWEAWKGMNGGALDLALRTEEHRALDVGGLPVGELTMAFPVRDVSALPFRAPTGDNALLNDLANMHVERLGMRPDANSGVLSDFFKVGMRGEECLVVPLVLSPPPEGHLPKRSPQAFDVSARCLPLPSDGVVIWQELNRWVFALAEEGQPLHFQALASNGLGEDAGREIRLTLSQLEMQGLVETAPRHSFVWVAEEEEPPTAEELAALGEGFGGTATVAAKPAPVIPPKTSQLLPADTRAERMAVRQRQQMVLMITAVAVAYLGLVAYLGYTLVESNKKTDAAKADYDAIYPEVIVFQDHKIKWEELLPVVEQEHNPVELLLHCAQARPDGGLRLERCDINNQLEVNGDERKLIRSIRLQGKADELEQVNTFNENVKRSSGLKNYSWNTPPATETNDGRWSFTYDAVYVGPLPTQ